jgi:hypothetical protein
LRGLGVGRFKGVEVEPASRRLEKLREVEGVEGIE